MSILEAEGLRVARGGRDVVALDRLALARGETLAILGPNGAGKTTLLLGLTTLLPAAGRLRFEGAAIADLTAYRRRIAVVFQRPLLLDRNVRENAMLGLALRGLPQPEREQRADAWLARLGIAHLARRSAVALSGGEAQRVSLARALSTDPEILFLDEPFAALDTPTRESLTADLALILRERQISTVLVTHERDEALSLADHIAVLIDGRVRQYGAPDAVFAMPADEEVAAFVGVENVLPARVVEVTSELTVLAVGDRTIEVTAVPPDRDDTVLLCVRPDDVVISLTRDAGSARNVLDSRIVRLEPLGRRVRVTLDSGFPLVAHVTTRSAREMELAPGQRISASFKATVPHLLAHHAPKVRAV